MFLVDTNVWLEGLLGQQQQTVVASFFECTPVTYLHITDFALHSIFLICLQRKYDRALRSFFDDVIAPGDVTVLSLYAQELAQTLEISKEQNLDFDDAYQYAVADAHNLKIVSFDADFDQTTRGCITPEQAKDLL